MFMMIMIATTVMAVSLTLIAFRRLPDLSTWALGLGFQALAYLTLSLRGQMSDTLSSVGANVCITAPLSLYLAGLYRFHHQRFPVWLLWVPQVILLGGLVVWINEYHDRAMLGSAIWLFQSLYLANLVVRFRRQTIGRGQYILGASALVFAMSMAYRCPRRLGCFHFCAFSVADDRFNCSSFGNFSASQNGYFGGVGDPNMGYLHRHGRKTGAMSPRCCPPVWRAMQCPHIHSTDDAVDLLCHATPVIVSHGKQEQATSVAGSCPLLAHLPLLA